VLPNDHVHVYDHVYDHVHVYVDVVVDLDENIDAVDSSQRIFAPIG